MNVLLVHPEFPDTFWGFRYALRFIAKRAAQPPLGLLTVAGLLPDNWHLRLKDLNVARLKDQDLEWADYVFMSAMSLQKWTAKQVIARCKSAQKPVVAGGPLFSTEPEMFPEADALVLGEAELIMTDLVEDMCAGSLRRRYSTSEKADVTATPPPRWDLIDMGRYAQMSLQYSRGCPFNCEFCAIGVLYGRGVRTKTPGQIETELDALYQAGWRGEIFLVDDNFIGNKRKLAGDILPALTDWMEEHRHPFRFGTEVSINLSDDPGLIRQMVRAGFASVFVGIESVSDQALAECNKQQNRNRDLLESVRRIQHEGLQVSAGFIIGFDSDKADCFERLREFIQRAGIPNAMVGLLNAPLQTRLYQRLQQEGRLLHDGNGNNTDGTVNFIPNMGIETLLQGYRDLIGKLFSPPAYYQRVKTFLKEYQPVKVGKFRMQFCHVWALASSVFRLGVIGRERRQYWSLLSWVLTHRPGLLPEAVAFSIYGFHYRMIFSRK